MIDSADYIVAKRASCSESLFFYCESNTSCNIVVFFEDDFLGILGTSKSNVFSTTNVTDQLENKATFGEPLKFKFVVINLLITEK